MPRTLLTLVAALIASQLWQPSVHATEPRPFWPNLRVRSGDKPVRLPTIQRRRVALKSGAIYKSAFGVRPPAKEVKETLPPAVGPRGRITLHASVNKGAEIPIFRRVTVRPLAAVHVVDAEGRLFSTMAGGGLNWRDYELQLVKGAGVVQGTTLKTAPYNPEKAISEGIHLRVRATAAYLRSRAAGTNNPKAARAYATQRPAAIILPPDLTYPERLALAFKPAAARPARAARVGRAGYDGRHGKHASKSGWNGGHGQHGSSGRHGATGRLGERGRAAPAVRMTVSLIENRLVPKPVWHIQFRDHRGRARDIYTYAGEPIHVDARGGDGGDGGRGGAGGRGGHGGNGGNGAQGRSGRRGRDGRRGRAGGAGHDANLLYRSSRGGHGGPGGRGSNGTDGKRGGNGGDGGHGAKGGDGGRGGHGGDGGRGAQVTILTNGSPHIKAMIKRYWRVDLRGGRPGEGGVGGPPGAGGRGGRRGAAGRGGPGGRGGRGGPGGRGGRGGRGWRGVNYQVYPPRSVYRPPSYAGRNGPRGPSGRNGRRGASGRSGKYGRRGAMGRRGTRGSPGKAGEVGLLVVEDVNLYRAKQRGLRLLVSKLDDVTRRAPNAKAAIALAEKVADQSSPDTNTEGSWQKVDVALTKGVQAASRSDDLDALERLLRRQIEASKRRK